MNPSRTIEYVLASLLPKGIRPTKDTENGRMPKGIQAIMPAKTEPTSDDLERAIYTRDIEITRRRENGKITLYASTYILPSATPKTLERAEMLSLEIRRPGYTEYASFDLLGPQAIPMFEHQSTTAEILEYNGYTPEESGYTPEEKALLGPKDSQHVMDWVIGEFLRLTR